MGEFILAGVVVGSVEVSAGGGIGSVEGKFILAGGGDGSYNTESDLHSEDCIGTDPVSTGGLVLTGA